MVFSNGGTEDFTLNPEESPKIQDYGSWPPGILYFGCAFYLPRKGKIIAKQWNSRNYYEVVLGNQESRVIATDSVDREFPACTINAISGKMVVYSGKGIQRNPLIKQVAV